MKEEQEPRCSLTPSSHSVISFSSVLPTTILGLSRGLRRFFSPRVGGRRIGDALWLASRTGYIYRRVFCSGDRKENWR